jgi:LysM repeat protein
MKGILRDISGCLCLALVIVCLAFPARAEVSFAAIQGENNQRIQSWIDFFSKDKAGRQFITSSMERSKSFLPQALPVIEQYKLPKEIVFLAMAESGFNRNAISSVGAFGPWQFMKATAKKYGLRDRRDIRQSTDAACRYLKDINQFLIGQDVPSSWSLIFASYNHGENGISAKLKEQRPRDFWEIRGLNKETYNHVPKIYALMEVCGNPKKYGFSFEPLRFKSRHEGPIIYVDNKTGRTIHKVGQGENLKAIAERHKVSVKKLCQWNSIRKYGMLEIGQRLIVSPPKDTITEVSQL